MRIGSGVGADAGLDVGAAQAGLEDGALQEGVPARCGAGAGCDQFGRQLFGDGARVGGGAFGICCAQKRRAGARAEGVDIDFINRPQVQGVGGGDLDIALRYPCPY